MRILIVAVAFGLCSFPAKGGDLENRIEALELRAQEREMNDLVRESNSQVEAIRRADAAADLEFRREMDAILKRTRVWRSPDRFRLPSEPPE